MTEAEWFACADPERMLGFLERRASDRKLRLFAVACCYVCRRGEVNDSLAEDYEAVVRFVDGLGTREAMRRRWLPSTDDEDYQTWPDRPFVWALDFASTAAVAPSKRNGHNENFPTAAEAVLLLRDLFGNPFRRFAFNPEWRTDTALALARQMYEGRDFGAMPILADALQDVGCDDEDVLSHCRDAGQVHARGCWVVDGVLGSS
jgi:hypothetical protein